MSKETLKQNCANIASQKFLMMQKSVPIAVKSKHQMAALSPLSLLLYCLF